MKITLFDVPTELIRRFYTNSSSIKTSLRILLSLLLSSFIVLPAQAQISFDSLRRRRLNQPTPAIPSSPYLGWRTLLGSITAFQSNTTFLRVITCPAELYHIFLCWFQAALTRMKQGKLKLNSDIKWFLRYVAYRVIANLKI